MKNILIFFAVLLVFTEGLILFHYSKYEKGEYDRICHSLYSQKVWIDTCYIPYNSEIKTFELARNIEIAGIILSGLALLFNFKKLNFKN